MKIVRIFPNVDTLLSVKYEEKEENEFNILFDGLNDVEFLRAFFNTHERDLTGVSIEEAIKQTLHDAKKLEDKLLDVVDGKIKLQTLFKPLSNSDYKLKSYQKSKAYGRVPKSWLRVYAVRIHEDLFVVSGGAIKLTRTMQEREHTMEQLHILNHLRIYLKEKWFDDDDLDNLETR